MPHAYGQGGKEFVTKVPHFLSMIIMKALYVYTYVEYIHLLCECVSDHHYTPLPLRVVAAGHSLGVYKRTYMYISQIDRLG